MTDTTQPEILRFGDLDFLSVDVIRDVIVVVLFDENGEDWPYMSRRDNKVYAVILGDSVKTGPVDSVYTHYDLLRTVEAVLDVKPMATGDGCAHVIREVWK